MSFFVTLLILGLLIAAGNFFFKPKTQTVNKEPAPKLAQIYAIGQAPRFSTQAQIQKTGVITINALSGGVVSEINVTEGQPVTQGFNLIQLSSSYDGSNAPGIQTAIAQKQYQLASDTLQSQKDIIQKQRDMANATNVNAADLRNINNLSAQDSQGLIDFSSTYLDQIDQTIRDLENTPGASQSATLSQAKGIKLQLQGGLIQAKGSQRQLQYQADSTNPPAQLADIQKDITLKQLDLQQKTLENSVEIARLSLSLAAVSASLLHPTAPFSGTVEKVLVRPGQSVAPGAPLFVINGDKSELTAVAKVSQKVAQTVSNYEDSTLYINNSPVMVKPSFVSDVATDGNLYTIIFPIPEGYSKDITDNAFINVDIPLGYPDTGAATPFIPLDSVYQTQDQAYVLVSDNGVAKSVKVTLGEVFGEYVEVVSGIKNGDKLILNRNILEGDKVSTS